MKRIYALFVAVSVVCSLYADIPVGLHIDWDYDENTYFGLETLSGNEAALTGCETTAEHITIPQLCIVEYEGSEYVLQITAIGGYGYVFSSCESLVSVEIPNSVKIIGNEAFYGCSSLTSIDIPASVESIGDGAFWECKSLTSVEIPNSVEIIREQTFAYCSSLASVEIPNSVKSIGNDAFFGCRSLASVDIPASVKSIGSYAFMYCSSLASVEIGDGRRGFLGVYIPCVSKDRR